MRLWQALRTWLTGAPHALGFSIFCAQVALGIVIFAIFQEFVPNNLGASDGFGGYLLALYGGARFLSETPAGAISDRIERKYALLLGFALMVPALALMGAIQQEWAYLGFSALLGISTAFIWPATYAIGADLYPPGERGKVVGFLNVGQLLGFGLGALVGALLVETVPDSLFIIGVVAVGGALITGQMGVPAYRRELGMVHEQRPPLRSVLSKRLVFLSALILSATIGISSLVPAIRPYGDNVLDISFAQLTVFLIPAVVAGGILYVPSGHLSDRIGRTIPLLLGQFLIIAGAMTAAATTNIFLAAAATAVIFSGHVQQVPALNASMMDLAPESYRGTLIGWSVALSGLGLAVGPALGGAVVDAYDAPMAFQVGAMVAGFTAVLTIAYGLVYGYARPAHPDEAEAEGTSAEG
ncbi:MAG: MFS transporter [Chloroflexi bacterium]|nr:MFS transporter [Chloroflexota bacterium]